MAKTDVTGFYAHKLNPRGGWSKAAGPKPTAANFEAAHKAGLRPGSEVAFANALMQRAGGMTRAQLAATGTRPQFNAAKHLEASGIVKRVPMPPVDGDMVYRYALTAKAGKVVKAATTAKVDGAAKAATPKAAKAAPRKRTAKAATAKAAPATEAPKVDGGSTPTA